MIALGAVMMFCYWKVVIYALGRGGEIIVNWGAHVPS